MRRSCLLSSDEVKAILNVPDFRSIPKDKLIEFVSAIPYMDKDVAIKAIEQFPAFSEFGQAMVSHYEDMCSDIIKVNGETANAVMGAYQRTLEVLSKLALKEDISDDDRHIFATQMVDVANKMAEFDSGNKNFLAEINKRETYITLFALLVGSVLLGVNLKGVKIPQMK